PTPPSTLSLHDALPISTSPPACCSTRSWAWAHPCSHGPRRSLSSKEDMSPQVPFFGLTWERSYRSATSSRPRWRPRTSFACERRSEEHTSELQSRGHLV